MSTLFVEGGGAVTPAGFDSLSTCAAIRAGLCAASTMPMGPASEVQARVARVKAGSALRRTPQEWLLNMAARALRESLGAVTSGGGEIGLFVCVPEESRAHEGLAGLSPAEVVDRLRRAVSVRFHGASRALTEGPAGFSRALIEARQLLASGAARLAVVGGFDSLVNSADIDRLLQAGRLHVDGNPQGAVPGEGAAFLLVSTSGRESGLVPLARIAGAGLAAEANTAMGERYSTGGGLVEAVSRALADSASVREPQVAFVVSNHNGERYAAWESAFAHPRAYRSVRSSLPVVYPAASVGETGAASAALGVLVAAVGLAKSYLPPGYGVCEFRSEGTGRGACVVGRSPHPSPFAGPAERRVRSA